MSRAALLRPFATACNEPDAPPRAARAAGQKVIGYLSNCAPVEMIRAAGAYAHGVQGDPTDATPEALTLLEPFFDGGILSIFQRLVDGRLGYLDALLVPRSSEVQLRLYYHMLEYAQLNPGARLPQPILFDILHTPFAATGTYNAGRLAALRARLGGLTGQAITDQGLAKAIAEADAVRAALAGLDALRKAKAPRLSGAEMMGISAAARRMPPEAFLQAAHALLAEARTLEPRPQGPRLLLTGSAQDDAGFHETVEALGATITGDDHGTGDWWHLDPVGDDLPPMQALLRKYHLNAPSPRTYPRARSDQRLLRAVEVARPEAVIFLTEMHDDTLGFDYPKQRDLLAARGLPCLFLKEQDYRDPDRAAQAAAVQAFLTGLSAPQKLASA